VKIILIAIIPEAIHEKVTTCFMKINRMLSEVALCRPKNKEVTAEAGELPLLRFIAR
jgi:hypothetical protein